MGTRRQISPACIAAFVAISIPLLLGMKGTEKPNLTGIVISDEKPGFSKESWFSGEYQEQRDDYNADHWAFREFMVRANNQLYYKAFNQIRVNNFVIGKNNYIFSEAYIRSAFGDDLLPEDKVESMMKKARVVQDTLRRKGIDLLFVYAPGKGAACREFVEDKYVHGFTRTNHDLYVHHGSKNGVNQLDLYRYFELLKGGSPYPLFPKFGHHWSYYGECLAVDTIIAHIEKLHNCDMPDITWSRVEISDTARSRDADVLKSMNLLSDPKQDIKLAYPEVRFEQSEAKNSTRVLTISDSYWYGPVYMGVGQNCFAGGQFWYYFNKVIPSPRPGEKVEVWELDLRQEIEANNVIMLLYSDANLPMFGNGFIEEAYEMYTQPALYAQRQERRRLIQSYAKQVREAPLLLKKATALSREQGITLDSAVKYEGARMAGLIKQER